MKKEVVLYVISDSIGETSQKLITAVAAQYPTIDFNNNYRFPFVREEEELLSILRDALKDKAIVISTLVNQALAQTAQAFSEKNSLQYYDLMHPFFQLIHAQTGILPKEEAGAVHKLNTEYFNRIAAMEFAVKYDDGKDPHGFLEADIVLIGISRTSKTPLSMYLANKGIKVANLPLIPEVPLPDALNQIDTTKIIGLVCQPENLVTIRQNRLHSLGLNSQTSYTDPERIQKELCYSYDVFEKYHAHVIDVSNKSIEETAYLVTEHLKTI